VPYAGEDSGPAPESASDPSRNDFPSYGKTGGVASFLGILDFRHIFLRPLPLLRFCSPGDQSGMRNLIWTEFPRAIEANDHRDLEKMNSSGPYDHRPAATQDPKSHGKK